MQVFDGVANVLLLGAFLFIGWSMWRDFLTSKMETERLTHSFDTVCFKYESLKARISRCEAALNTRPIGPEE